MFTPEFVNEKTGEFALVASHNLESAESVRLSIDYNMARITYGLSQLPPHIRNCRILYDVRFQSFPDSVLDEIKHAFREHATVEFIR
ncbi:hypothetical protein [Klebsiella sp. BIGb0407]|uniref:hypothetical protein n=1 Tax=Klebsiella sp. BIGb0407 TaxID=2940603 RepID=UPI0021692777|nr:hypothetical protein [Klebsiella sp. BIGb0407]MCS3433513.1 hypothetical protein [Klebsiella sp. BIGb0407]